jgi:hypothetical protein
MYPGVSNISCDPTEHAEPVSQHDVSGTAETEQAAEEHGKVSMLAPHCNICTAMTWMLSMVRLMGKLLACFLSHGAEFIHLGLDVESTQHPHFATRIATRSMDSNRAHAQAQGGCRVLASVQMQFHAVLSRR